ncbi:class I SAM-dependent methyltransferase [Peribacillus sp. NPDC096622]|uniref:class I SAM-dependent methyltransferase n=1 Tax=Peribacillus sp. NPDC096622 TaxID=3364396 RepID=UPI00381BA2F3
MDTKACIKLSDLSESIGAVYGSETISLLLYTLAKRQKPECVVELGTGLGLSSLWMGQALKENGLGQLYTIDNGQDAHLLLEVIKQIFPDIVGDDPKKIYEKYIELLIKSYDLKDQVNYISSNLDLSSKDVLLVKDFSMINQPIDLVFADTLYGPYDILNILRQFLPYMNEYSSIFIDSASTHLPSYLTLERIIDDLNKSKIPQHFLSLEDKTARWDLFQLVSQRKFRLVHLTEKEKRLQNSTAWIIIEPNEYIPHPDVQLH